MPSGAEPRTAGKDPIAARARWAYHAGFSLPTMSFLNPHWRSFQSVSSGAEAASFSECCLYSLGTLEVDCDPATRSFALTEQEQPGAWRWAIVDDLGDVLHAGCETTQGEAKKVAAEALYHGWTAPRAGRGLATCLTS
jgi:hypothetical protein